MLKKVLLSTILGVTLLSNSVLAVEIHKECFMHPVIVKQVEEYDSIHDLTYMKNEFYDGITAQKIDLLFETIYMDDQDNRWYFPYDGTKIHIHE